MADDALLPWERPDGAPQGVGICLSGGGLRSAAFSLGVLHTLQERQGLLFGPGAADHLAAVSGGSYAAAAFTLAAAEGGDALSPESPVGRHVATRARYLVEDGRGRMAWRFGGRAVANALAGLMLFIWAGVMLADVAVSIDHWIGPPVWPEPWSYVGWLGSVGAWMPLVRLMTYDSARQVLPRTVVVYGAIILCAPSFVEVTLSTPALRQPTWWPDHVALLAAFAGAFAVATIASVLPLPADSSLRAVSRTTSSLLPKVVTVLMLTYTTAAVQPWFVRGVEGDLESDTQAIVLLVAFFAVLLGGAWASYVPDVVSLHRLYRDLVSRCFAVAPDGDGIRPAPDAAISSLAPPADRGPGSFPRLLICATANIRHRRPGQRRERDHASYVFSHDSSGIPGVPGASFATTQLEMGRARVSVFGRKKEPELSLMTAVGMTGAAMAPSMGSLTVVGVRPVIALLNARLGVWLSNPLSRSRREVVAARPDKPPPLFSLRRSDSGRLGPGAEALLSEFLGLHLETARRVFVTDGGHFDNLQARCETIWCVDASSKHRHLGRQLERVAELARVELGVTITVDTSPFGLVNRRRREAGAAVVTGTVAYPGQATLGRLIVIKLALTPTTPTDLVEYRRHDRRFPYHPTWLQWYDEPRFTHYHRLGTHIASEAVTLATASTPVPGT